MIENLSVEDKPMLNISRNVHFAEDCGKFKNRVEIILRDAFTGEIKDYRNQVNVVTTIGRNFVGDNWIGRSNVYQLDTSSGLIAVGTGSATLAVGQSGLGTEVSQASGGRSVIGTVARANSASGLQLGVTFYSSGANATGINEVGLFGKGYSTDESTLLTPTLAPNTGALVARANVSGTGINKTSSDTLTVNWYLSYAP